MAEGLDTEVAESDGRVTLRDVGAESCSEGRLRFWLGVSAMQCQLLHVGRMRLPGRGWSLERRDAQYHAVIAALVVARQGARARGGIRLDAWRDVWRDVWSRDSPDTAGTDEPARLVSRLLMMSRRSSKY
jgi:hypothetical protein